MTKKEIETRLINLENAFLQSQSNGIKVTENADKVMRIENVVTEITPYIETQKAYIGETEKTFCKGKNGIINVSCVTENGLSIPTTFEVLDNNVIVGFESLKELATITISIQ